MSVPCCYYKVTSEILAKIGICSYSYWSVNFIEIELVMRSIWFTCAIRSKTVKCGSKAAQKSCYSFRLEGLTEADLVSRSPSATWGPCLSTSRRKKSWRRTASLSPSTPSSTTRSSNPCRPSSTSRTMPAGWISAYISSLFITGPFPQLWVFIKEGWTHCRLQ